MAKGCESTENAYMTSVDTACNDHSSDAVHTRVTNYADTITDKSLVSDRMVMLYDAL